MLVSYAKDAWYFLNDVHSLPATISVRPGRGGKRESARDRWDLLGLPQTPVTTLAAEVETPATESESTDDEDLTENDDEAAATPAAPGGGSPAEG